LNQDTSLIDPSSPGDPSAITAHHASHLQVT